MPRQAPPPPSPRAAGPDAADGATALPQPVGPGEAPTALRLQAQARALGHPTRHRIFRYVADADHPVDVAELTRHEGLNHNAIRQHLAKLVEAGLLVERSAPSGSRGRPRLVYEADAAADGRWGVIGPYERLSLLLAEVVRTGETPVEVGRRAGTRPAFAPTRHPGTVAGLVESMARQGFEPELLPDGTGFDVVLHECPFSTTALADPDTVCSLHRGIAEGLAEAIPGVVVEDLVANDARQADCLLRLRIER